MNKDFVAEFVEIVQEITPIDETARANIEQTIRMRYGGERIAIRPTAPLDFDRTIEKIDQQLRQRVPVREIAQNTGVHRMTIYRWLKKSRTNRQKCGND